MVETLGLAQECSMLSKPWTYFPPNYLRHGCPVCKTDSSGDSVFGKPSFPSSLGSEAPSGNTFCYYSWDGVWGSGLSPPPTRHSGRFLWSIPKATPDLRGTAWTHFTGRHGDDVATTGRSAHPGGAAASIHQRRDPPSPFLRCQPQLPAAESWGREGEEHAPPSDRLLELPFPAPPARNFSGQR